MLEPGGMRALRLGAQLAPHARPQLARAATIQAPAPGGEQPASGSSSSSKSSSSGSSASSSSTSSSSVSNQRRALSSTSSRAPINAAGPSSSSSSTSTSCSGSSSYHPFADFEPSVSARASEPLSSVPDALDSMSGPLGHASTSSSPSAGFGSSFPSPSAAWDAPSPDDMAVARVTLRQPWSVPAPRRRHPFDSHAFVSSLEKASLAPPTAKTLMEGVRAVLIQRTERAGARMLGREEADNEAYVFRAALSKLRTEFNVRTRNTGLEARNGVSAVRRELEHLERKMAGDMQVLKHDVEMDMNSSKDENRNDKKTLDILIEEINSRATISIGDLKTEIESAKWDSTRRAISIIVVLVICGVGISTLTLGDKPDPPRPTEPKVDEATTRDIGIGTDADYPLIDYEARIDKILDSVPPPEPQRPRKRSKSEPWTDRIERI